MTKPPPFFIMLLENLVAKKSFTWHNSRNLPVSYNPGDAVIPCNISEAEHLVSMGSVCSHQEYFSLGEYQYIDPVRTKTKELRIGIWLATGMHYSGGRIHMYQYAHTMANLGAEVYLLTNASPLWARDYPKNDKLHILINSKNNFSGRIPPDLDIAITDSKAKIAAGAIKYTQKHNVPLFVMNFETPNWIKNFDEKYSKNISTNKKSYNVADYFVANSRESEKYLREWMEKDIDVTVLRPAVNTYAAEKPEKPQITPDAPYAVYSARGAKYKGGDWVAEAIWKMKTPFDLVVFGQLPGTSIPENTNNHRLHIMSNFSDANKFYMMQNAAVVLAPSKFEGAGMVPMEALASGTPCLVYDLPVLREIYGDKLLYSEWGNKQAYIDKLSRIVDNSASVSVSDTVRDEAKHEYGMDSMREQVQKIPCHCREGKRVSAHMISYWGFVPQSLESIYDHCDDITIAYGPVKVAQHVQPDGSLEKIQEWIHKNDTKGKIRLIAKPVWKNKRQMRNECVKHATGNYHLLLDGDEIWTGLDKWLSAPDYTDWTAPRWVNLWHGGEYWIYDSDHGTAPRGRRWGEKLKPYGSLCPHYRWSYWRPSFYFRSHPVASDRAGNRLHSPKGIYHEQDMTACIYHLGHALPRDTMTAKHEFYRNRDGDDDDRKARQKAWHDWTGASGESGDGYVAKVDWDLPDIVRRGLNEIR